MSDKRHMIGDIFIRKMEHRDGYNVVFLTENKVYVNLLGCTTGIINTDKLKSSTNSIVKNNYKFVGNIEDMPKIAEELGVFKDE